MSHEASTSDSSSILTGDDTIASVQAHWTACERSRRTAAGLAFDEVVTGRGERPARHRGHADIPREQVTAARG